MKSLLKLFSPLLIVSLLFSCQQEVDDLFDEENNPSTNVNGDLKAKIDGVQWVANKAASAQIFGGRIAIAGISTDKKTFVISLADSGVHRYMLTDVTLNAAALSDSAVNPISFTSNGGDYPDYAGGEVNVTSIDTVNKKIAGTFAFKLFRQLDSTGRNITEGSFNLSYTTTLPAAATTDTLRAKVNGVAFVPHMITGFAASSPMSIVGVSATAASGFPSLGLMMPGNITPGTYNLDFFSGTHTGTYGPDNDGTHTQASTSGPLVILEHNTTSRRIRGTFAFRAENLLDPTGASDITEGYFSVKY